MDKIIYTRGRTSQEPQSIQFEVSSDMTCIEFRNMCTRMAYSLGYAESSIDIAFPRPKNSSKSSKNILLD
jgi:hypothetical protein|tara:strand:- start:535 stop:744 length:210 start_codon:yes stop_codon:yes gene_type:complete